MTSLGVDMGANTILIARLNKIYLGSVAWQPLARDKVVSDLHEVLALCLA